MLRDRIEADEATKRRVPEFEMRASMHGAQLVFEKQVPYEKQPSWEHNLFSNL